MPIITGTLTSKNVNVWLIRTDADKAIKPARSISKFLDKSKRVSDLFSGIHSANPTAAIRRKIRAYSKQPFTIRVSDIYLLNPNRSLPNKALLTIYLHIMLA